MRAVGPFDGDLPGEPGPVDLNSTQGKEHLAAPGFLLGCRGTDDESTGGTPCFLGCCFQYPDVTGLEFAFGAHGFHRRCFELLILLDRALEQKCLCGSLGQLSRLSAPHSVEVGSGNAYKSLEVSLVCKSNRDVHSPEIEGDRLCHAR